MDLMLGFWNGNTLGWYSPPARGSLQPSWKSEPQQTYCFTDWNDLKDNVQTLPGWNVMEGDPGIIVKWVAF
jgi:hypothetical protein